jgi:hypothetical protein
MCHVLGQWSSVARGCSTLCRPGREGWKTLQFSAVSAKVVPPAEMRKRRKRTKNVGEDVARHPGSAP